ncbi:L-arabinokinase isoform X2 [Dendrobium catenatum]|uniref:L-arabinokinase isoform X2 n=1 Tax=Dendrobium catenatum TaxID=906689 RepID=UPI0009F49B7B|nr:L-arabinokinase isoform X2 [Dendrobium catenatum]
MGIENAEAGGDSHPMRRLVFVYYVTGHGFGHATRVVEIVRHLIEAGHEVNVVTGAPEFVFTGEIKSSNLKIRNVLLDCGAVQTDALTVDRLASLEKYRQTAVKPRDLILATEVEWLKSIKADLVVSDVVPLICRAAVDARIRSICVTNFSWDFIYAEYIMTEGFQHHSIVWQIAEDYSHCEFVIRLPGYSPMPAFRDAIDVPLVVRRVHKSRSEVRMELGIGEDVKLLIFNFGGQPADWKLQEEWLPSGWLCLVCGASDTQELPPNFIKVRKDAYTPDLIAASDCMLGKIGYGTFSEALAYRLPFVFVRRDYFNEEPFLRNTLEYYEGGVEMIRRDFLAGQWIPYLSRALMLHPCYDGGINGGEVVAQLLQDTADGKNCSPVKDEIYIARAPGRLDVMGGIADYSGSLVLQMPIREACHVALQRNNPNKQRLWKHALARQKAKERFTPLLQIVSFGSELSNRAPTFDMDLSDFVDGEQLLSYEKAQKYFAKDPSQKWAAYIAGTILVLMVELGVLFTDSISILVSSAVPEGKGVSSSAAIEVATMSAIAAAHGLSIDPRDLALLCQKVENLVVGAPCGVMDQMASACGEANKLLAMVCQPAEVKELVTIPTHIRFWGIDSGIRHSVGGTDYGSVRIGTFMGRKMIKSLASSLLSRSVENTAVPIDVGDNELDVFEEENIELLRNEASLNYLCKLPTHRYEAAYAKKLPKLLTGQIFLEKYVDHDDTVTVIDPGRSYAIRAPTKHPIYENFRVEAFKALLSAATAEEQLSALGELMYQCHYSYSDCGLGSDGTDRLVELVQEMQHRNSPKQTNLFGAKITGGGSGGSVCVIGRNNIESSKEILEIQQRYKNATGYLPIVFDGSSPGAGKFGYLKVRCRPSAKSSMD